ncbi:MAG: MBL fold metallo-hydrolase [Alphaproteobacteria bacterium]|nr:MAG: MBL fold metallo-hydrolase [Alphaproteobacteria bacterium]
MGLRISRLAAAASFIGTAFVASPAWADDVVIQRDVTVRAAPTKASQKLDFPAVGTRLDLLDDGARQHGYYHVRLPDGREGWVYQSFVRRVSDSEGAVAAIPQDRLQVHYIDVDQGNAALVEASCGAVLIDAGGGTPAAGQHLIDYLTAFFARRPDLNRHLAAVFITHTHLDHNSNLRRVAEAFTVERYIHNGLRTGSGRRDANWMLDQSGLPAERMKEVKEVGDVPVSGDDVDPLNCQGVDPKIEVLSGGNAQGDWSAEDFNNGNNHSLVIRIDFGAASFLFPGDLENAGIDRLLAKQSMRRELDVDVYEVNHHGAANGTTDAWLAALTPKMAVISMGPSTVQAPWTGWAYGHPRRVSVDLLERNVSLARTPVTEPVADGAKRFSAETIDKAIYATGWDGDVTVTAAADGTLTTSTAGHH